jgi:VanZ family protein
LPSGGAVNRGNRAAIRALAPLALMGLIFFLSAQQADEGLAWWEVVVRKLGHIGGYALLTALWTWALATVVRRPVLAAATIALLYACTDEYHQSFVETRHGSPIDVGVDAIGIAVTSWLLALRRGTLAYRDKSNAVGRASTRSSPAR